MGTKSAVRVGQNWVKLVRMHLNLELEKELFWGDINKKEHYLSS